MKYAAFLTLLLSGCAGTSIKPSDPTGVVYLAPSRCVVSKPPSQDNLTAPVDSVSETPPSLPDGECDEVCDGTTCRLVPRAHPAPPSGTMTDHAPIFDTPDTCRPGLPIPLDLPPVAVPTAVGTWVLMTPLSAYLWQQLMAAPGWAWFVIGALLIIGWISLFSFIGRCLARVIVFVTSPFRSK